ncbi:MAG: hypothetical protein WC628_02000 [Candidatus Omnitrophota bacterium]
MRDLLFKNLTSVDKKRRVISSSEISDRQGMRSVIRRHFAYIVKELDCQNYPQARPYVYVLKERNTKEHKEKFFCRIKGSIYARKNAKTYQVLFMHSLKIDLAALPEPKIT